MTTEGKKSLLASAITLVLAEALSLPAAHAATAPGAAGSDLPEVQSYANLDSKLKLVKLLLDNSPAVKRIPQSNHAKAKQGLADAQALYNKAAGESDQGRKAAAVKLLDEALRLIVSASAMVPDPAQQAAQEQARYAGLLQAARSFEGLYKTFSARLPANKASAPLDSAQVNAAIQKAETLAASGKHGEANVVLNEAYKTVVSSLNKLLLAETIVYDQKFDTPAAEFASELARNRSYEELVPLALTQLNTPRESAALSERYVQQSRELRQRAQQQASGGDYGAAIRTLQEATGHLQRSLRVAGVVVPQAAASNP